MKLWKRNAIVVVIVLFVGVAVYLNWSYGQNTTVDGDAVTSGKLLGEAALVSGSSDPKESEPVNNATNTNSTNNTKNPDSNPQESKSAQETPAATASPDPSASPSAPSSASSTGYFASARLNRQQARDSALEILQEAAADAMANQEVIDDANASIQKLAGFTLAEAQVENLVTAKGYDDCVCYINENSASVVVSSTLEGLTETDTARIAEIVMDETGLSFGQITIIETDP